MKQIRVCTWMLSLCVVYAGGLWAQQERPRRDSDPLQKLQRPVAAEPEAPGKGGPLTPSPEVRVLRLIKYSGVVKDVLGRPRTGVVGMTFALYREPEGGSPLWLETQNVEIDPEGRYSVLLGAETSDGLPLEIFASEEARWLGLRVQGEEEQPRILLVSVPYALKAADAERLGGKPASAFLVADSPVEGAAKAGKEALGSGSGPTALTVDPGSVGDIVKYTAAPDTLGPATNFVEVSGKVGIGTTTPLATLHTETAGGPFWRLSRAGFPGFLKLEGAGVDARLGSAGSAIPVIFITNDAERMRIDGSGNVGIGTTSAAAKLDVAGTVKATSFMGDGSGISGVLRVRSITYLGGCDSCDVLTDGDDQRAIYVNLLGAMTINSVTCFADAGTPNINLQRDDGSAANILASDLACSTSGATTAIFSGGENVLNLNDKLDFVMAAAGGAAKRVTVTILATLN